MELFKSMAGVDVVRIAYKGSGPALNSMIGGQEQMMIVTASSGADASTRLFVWRFMRSSPRALAARRR